MPITAETDHVTHSGEDAGMDAPRSLYIILILPLLAFLSSGLCLLSLWASFSPMGGVKKDLVTHTRTSSAKPPPYPTPHQ